MPPREYRCTRKDFTHERAKKILRGTLVDIRYAQSDVTKVACIISKKTFRRAVDRNKVKRKAYTAWTEAGMQQGCAFMYPKKQALHASIADLKKEIVILFATLNATR